MRNGLYKLPIPRRFINRAVYQQMEEERPKPPKPKKEMVNLWYLIGRWIGGGMK